MCAGQKYRFLNARLELGSTSGKGYGRISFHENPYEILRVFIINSFRYKSDKFLFVTP